MFAQYEDNDDEANRKYLDKVLEISGMVSDMESNQDQMPVLVFATNNPVFGIRCSLSQYTPDVKPGDSVRVVGICTGFLSDVMVVNATVKNQ